MLEQDKEFDRCSARIALPLQKHHGSKQDSQLGPAHFDSKAAAARVQLNSRIEQLKGTNGAKMISDSCSIRQVCQSAGVHIATHQCNIAVRAARAAASIDEGRSGAASSTSLVTQPSIDFCFAFTYWRCLTKRFRRGITLQPRPPAQCRQLTHASSQPCDCRKKRTQLLSHAVDWTVGWESWVSKVA